MGVLLHSEGVGAKRCGGPAGIRTLDTRIKSPMLCQAELQAHNLLGKRTSNFKWGWMAIQG